MIEMSNETNKILFDGKTVDSKGYYYLLMWNDSDSKKYINEKFNKQRLGDLNIEEYKQLFKHATETDLANIS